MTTTLILGSSTWPTFSVWQASPRVGITRCGCESSNTRQRSEHKCSYQSLLSTMALYPKWENLTLKGSSTAGS